MGSFQHLNALGSVNLEAFYEAIFSHREFPANKSNRILRLDHKTKKNVKALPEKNQST